MFLQTALVFFGHLPGNGFINKLNAPFNSSDNTLKLREREAGIKIYVECKHIFLSKCTAMHKYAENSTSDGGICKYGIKTKI